MKRILTYLFALSLLCIPATSLAQEAPGGPGGGDAERLVDFPIINASNVSSASIAKHSVAEACSETDEIHVVLDGMASNQLDPLSLDLGTTTCSGGTWSFIFDASVFADGVVYADVWVNNLGLVDDEPTTKDTVGPAVSLYLGGTSYETALIEGHIFDTGEDLLFIEFQSDDANSISCSIDSATVSPCDQLFDYNETYTFIYGYDFSGIAAGPHSFTTVAIDNNDNTSTSTVNFCMDTCETPRENPTVTLALRDGDTYIGPLSVDLPEGGMVDVYATGSTTPHRVASRSVLALLLQADATQESFAITDLRYDYGIGEFTVECVAIPSTSSSDRCSGWLYALDGEFPAISIDSYQMSEGQSAILFFGASSTRITLDRITVEESENFTATAEKYDPETHTYAGLAERIIGIFAGDAASGYTVYATTTSNSDGQATLTAGIAGEYLVGVLNEGKDDSFFSPNTTLTVTKAVANGGGGGSNPPSSNGPIVSNAPSNPATSTMPAIPAATSTPGSTVTTSLAVNTPSMSDQEDILAAEVRGAQVDAPRTEEPPTMTEPETREEAVQQLAAAAAIGIDWRLLILALLALILFGITGYIAFVRKYWR